MTGDRFPPALCSEGMSKLVAAPRRLRAPTLLAWVVALALGCGSPAPSSAVGNIYVLARSLLATPTTSLRLAVQSSSVLANPLKVPVMVSADEYSALLPNLPVGNDYVITADALDRNNVILAHGIAAGVSIRKGKTTEVIIYLNRVIAQPPFTNSSPLIDSITLSSDVIAPGGQVALTGTAHDPDAGQTATLDFAWLPAASCGTISGVTKVPGTDAGRPSKSLAIWTAPQVEGNCPITLAVKDVLGLATSASFVVRVGADTSETGVASVSLVFNDPPVIVGIVATPPQLSTDSSNSGVLEVIATDPENDNLGYAWSSDPNSPCTVDFATPTQASTEFTATTTQPDADHCTFVVTVDDGVWPDTGLKKNSVTAVLTLPMTTPPEVQTAPDFSIAYQSYDTATGGTVAWFGAIVSDPAGGTLSYDWSASSGSPPQATSPTLLGLDPAFTSAATWTVPDGAENMTSDLQVSVTATSSASNLQSTKTFTLKPANLP